MIIEIKNQMLYIDHTSLYVDTSLYVNVSDIFLYFEDVYIGITKKFITSHKFRIELTKDKKDVNLYLTKELK